MAEVIRGQAALHGWARHIGGLDQTATWLLLEMVLLEDFLIGYGIGALPLYNLLLSRCVDKTLKAMAALVDRSAVIAVHHTRDIVVSWALR